MRLYRVVVDTEEAIRSITESFERLAVGARHSVRSAAARLSPDLQPAAWPVFREVARTGRIQASAIVSTLGMDKSAVSRHLKELREQGLVEAERDDQDARIVWISPTPLAIRQSAAVFEDRQSRLRSTLTGWSPEDLERFAVLLDRLAPATGPWPEP